MKVNKALNELFGFLEEKFNECIEGRCEEHNVKINCNEKDFDRVVIFRGEMLKNKLKGMGEKRLSEGKTCDCFIYCTLRDNNLLNIVLVELKRGGFIIKEIEEKFENSVQIIEYIFNLYGNEKHMRNFYPVFVYKDFKVKGPNVTAAASKKLWNIKINFENRSYPLMVEKDKGKSPDLFKIIKEN